MTADRTSDVDLAIRDAKARLDKQRRLVAECEAKGYDTGAPLTLLSCLVDHLRKLEDRRRELMRKNDDLVVLS